MDRNLLVLFMILHSFKKIVEFWNLRELAVSKTCLSDKGQATLLTSLSNLQLLPRSVSNYDLECRLLSTKCFLLFRGDYLCEALEWIAWDEIYQAKPYPVFNIR
jgi:hypothetical protein